MPNKISIITGKVIKGDGYGRKLGFPTANLETKDVLPPPGVYAGKAIIENKNYRAGILINPNGKVEAHLIDFNKVIYGETLTIETKKFLREYRKFDTEEELIIQIKKDLDQC